MSNYDEVVKAAAFLDRYGPSGWRGKVNVNKLDMSSLWNCILGQVYGNYDDGVMKLQYKSGYEEDWFCKYTDSWKEYLRSGVTATPDVKYVGKNTGNSITVHKQFEVNGTEYFVFSYDDDPFSARMYSKEGFEANYKVVPLKPKYNDGQLYVGRHGSDKKEYVYMYRAANESFITLNDGRWARVDWHEEQNGGPLKAADIYTDRGKAIVAKVQK